MCFSNTKKKDFRVDNLSSAADPRKHLPTTIHFLPRFLNGTCNFPWYGVLAKICCEKNKHVYRWEKYFYGITMKPVCNDHLYNKIYLLCFIQ